MCPQLDAVEGEAARHSSRWRCHAHPDLCVKGGASPNHTQRATSRSDLDKQTSQATARLRFDDLSLV
jgi:hypothetical protein